MEEKLINIGPFLDEDGRVKQLPVKQSKCCAVLQYLADKFEEGRIYSALEVNEHLRTWCDADFMQTRRDMVDSGYLKRENDGSRYWIGEKTVPIYSIHLRKRNERPVENEAE